MDERKEEKTEQLSGKNHQTNEERKRARETGLFRGFVALGVFSYIEWDPCQYHIVSVVQSNLWYLFF